MPFYIIFITLRLHIHAMLCFYDVCLQERRRRLEAREKSQELRLISSSPAAAEAVAAAVTASSDQ